MNIYHLMARAGAVYRDLPGVAVGDEVRFSYGDLHRRCLRLAGGLTDILGLERGDRVAVIAKNNPSYFEVMWAAWAAGLVIVPVNAKLHPREIAYIVADSGARAALVSSDMKEAVEDVARDAPALEKTIGMGAPDYEQLLAAGPAEVSTVDRDELAWLFYTSGTTGRPKGAMLTHANLLAMTASYFLDIDQISPGDAILHAAPLSHGSGLYGLPNVAMGACQVIPDSGGFDAAEICALIARWPGASMFAAPTMVRRLVAHAGETKPDLTNLRVIIYGGAPMLVADVKRALDVLGPRLAQLYGQGESPMCITGLGSRWYANREHPGWEAIIGSAGFPQTVVEVAVVDEQDNPLPPGEAGEIVARGAPVMKGYWNNPEATARTLRDGWLHTGDIGKLDESGFLTLMDRSKDVIISGGANIYPREVEEAILTHEGVAEVSVVGAPDDDWGEAVTAFIVCSGESLSEAALDVHVRAQIARFKRPRRYIFLESLPKSSYGKILKRELRAILQYGTKPREPDHGSEKR